MKKLFSKTISVLLALTMILSLVGTSAFAADFTKFKADNGEVTLDGTNPGTVTVAWVGTGDQNIYALEGNWSTKETEGTSYLTLTAITSDVVTFGGMNTADAASGIVKWSDDSFSAPGAVSNGKALLKATYQVAADTPAGTYTVTYSSKLVVGDDFENDERAEVVTAKITVKGSTPAHEHVWSAAWSKDATHHWHDCTATGCDVTVNADKNGYAAHTYNKKVATKDYLKTAANCTDAAVYFYSCECGAKGTETFTEGTALGHNPSTEWSKDAIHHWHVCTTCNAEMDKAAHTPDHEGGATETYPIKCTECGYVIEAQLDHTHSFTQEVAEAKYLKSAAGCDAPAVYYKSCTCGEASTTETFQYGTALGHSYTAEKVADQYLKDAAGCETDAVYFKSCARCGAKGTETFTVANSALGHKGGAWQSDETGHWKVCERVNCGKRFNEGTHDGGKATCQAKAACTTCGAAYGELGAHDMDTKWSSNDTQHFHKCLTKGCDYIKDAADHSGGKATCKEKAKCDVCAAEYGNLGAHTLTKTAAKAPTCLEPGNNEYYTCSVCGKVFKDAAGTTETTVAAETLAKSTTHVVESKYATSATEHWQICKVCGTVVGKAAHKFGEADANGRKTCADCGYTVGGTGTEGHKHAAGNTICYDENNHWNKCTDDNCDAHVNESAHKFGPKNTVTEGNKTITIETCSECGYVKRTETTTGGTTPVNPGGNKPTKPGTKDNGKTVQSGKTFDAGVGVYVGLSILSLTGSAVVIGKKRKTR